MELPSKLIEQIAYNTRGRIEEHLLIVMDKSTHEEYLSQPLQTNNKKFKVAVNFPTAYNGIFKTTDKNNKFYFAKSLTKDYIIITLPPETYEIESLRNEFKRIIINEDHYTEANYPFKMKPIFSTLGSIIEISSQGPILTSVPDDSMGDLLGFGETSMFSKNNQSDNPVDILSFDNIFIHTDIAQG